MKMTAFRSIWVLGLVLTITASGCKTNYHPSGNIWGPRNPEPTKIDDGKGVAEVKKPDEGLPPVAADLWNQYKKDAEIFKDYTVHFPLDSATVNDSETAKIAAVAAYLKAHADERLQVDGYCDERGTAEYNRELGDRRALVLLEKLAQLGIDPMHVKTISWGFEHPVDTSHNETAWSKNRRGQWVLLTPPEK
jgi:peptidoglycan-associated lipoprotein